MALNEYQHKRNFKKTPEPKGKSWAFKKPKKLIFVVQKHAASHLHYDFRLEMNGVLKSWAVPKGPSLDPNQKRLAMEVEDHPLEYASFEGTIPQGQYGGGTVMVWDQGIWELSGSYEESYKRGKLEFILHGKKLKGKWILLRIEKNKQKSSWLLVKARDDESRNIKQYDILKEQPLSVMSQRDLDEIAADKTLGQTEFAKTVTAILKKNKAAKPINKLPKLSPQLAVLVNKAPEGDQWLHEVKFDGYRLLACFNNDHLKLITRNGNDWTNKLQPIADAIKPLKLINTILDGELVAIDKNNHISFQLLQNAIHFNKPAKLIYYIFDMPFCLGFNIRSIGLQERKQILKKLFELEQLSSVLQYSDHIQGSGKAIWQTSCELGLEGVISKHVDSPYESRRTKNWLKVKCVRQQEFLIIGFLHSKKRDFSSLLLGYYDDDLNLHYCGHVGTGFSHATSEYLVKELTSLIQTKISCKNIPNALDKKNTVWTKPELIAVIKFSEWTEEKILRQPVFLGLRSDKNPTEVRLEQSALTSNVEKSKSKITNKNKIIFPDKNFSKSDLANYYLNISQWILPHIVNRPLMLLRCPSGQEKNCFFQKHHKDELSKDIYAVDIQEKQDTKTYLYIKDKAGLLALSQLAVIEIHTWGSTIEAIEYPDHMIFDLDPGPGITWQQVIQAAYCVQDCLQQKKLKSFVKTSGKKGLHVVVPLVPHATWDEVKTYARNLVTDITRKYPDQYVGTMSKEKRQSKIFIDYFRNNRGATTVAPYSCRANLTASVSLPLAWSELNSIPSADYFDIVTAVQRLKSLSKDPWRDFFKFQRKNKL